MGPKGKFSPRLTVSIFFHLPNKGARRSSFPVLLLSKPKKKMRGRKVHRKGIFACLERRKKIEACDYEEKFFPHGPRNTFSPKERKWKEIFLLKSKLLVQHWLKIASEYFHLIYLVSKQGKVTFFPLSFPLIFTSYKQEKENTFFFLLLCIYSLSILPWFTPVHGIRNSNWVQSLHFKKISIHKAFKQDAGYVISYELNDIEAQKGRLS